MVALAYFTRDRASYRRRRVVEARRAETERRKIPPADHGAEDGEDRRFSDLRRSRRGPKSAKRYFHFSFLWKKRTFDAAGGLVADEDGGAPSRHQCGRHITSQLAEMLRRRSATSGGH